MPEGQVPIFTGWGQVILAITSLLILVLQIYREYRARKWQEEDRIEKNQIKSDLNETKEAVHKVNDIERRAMELRTMRKSDVEKILKKRLSDQ